MNKKVVVLGGGTGLSSLLKGIKYVDNIDISAIVTVADSGGSTAIISHHFDIPAVGDLRKVIASLSRNRENLEQSMEYRISGTKTDLDGHTIGNLILTSQILMKKDFAKGIEAATKMLNVSGSIIPVSNVFTNLIAELEDGSVVVGEANIGHAKSKILRVYYENGVASQSAIDAIKQADYIIFGIGSLYTSLIANLVYPKIQKALLNSDAEIIYFANIFTQHGETDNYKLSDHIKAIEDHTHKGIIDKIIVSNTRISNTTITSYIQDGQHLMDTDVENVLFRDLVSEFKDHATKQVSAKHDPKKIKRVINELIELERDDK